MPEILAYPLHNEEHQKTVLYFVPVTVLKVTFCKRRCVLQYVIGLTLTLFPCLRARAAGRPAARIGKFNLFNSPFLVHFKIGSINMTCNVFIISLQTLFPIFVLLTIY